MKVCLLSLLVLAVAMIQVKSFETCNDCTTCEGNLLTNCGFAIGDFTGWVVEDSGNPRLPMQVVHRSSLNPLPPPRPPHDIQWGNFTALNGFEDLSAIDHILLKQDVYIPELNPEGGCRLEFATSGVWMSPTDPIPPLPLSVHIEQPPGNEVFSKDLPPPGANGINDEYCTFLFTPIIPITGVISPGPARLVFDWKVKPTGSEIPLQARLNNVILRCQGLQLNAFTKASTGGVCFFDQSRTDCAICTPGACQCGPLFHTTCIECNRGIECAKEYAIQRGVTSKAPCTNSYTYQPHGTPCSYDNADTSCAACENNGCQCGPSMGHVCIPCGSDGSQCLPEASAFLACESRPIYPPANPCLSSGRC